MTVSMNTALNAYRSATQSVESTGQNESRASTVQLGQAFTDLLKDNLTESVSAGKNSEQMSILALQGKAHLRDVVNAVANAETALQTVVAVRNKVLSAYQEILKMTI